MSHFFKKKFTLYPLNYTPISHFNGNHTLSLFKKNKKAHHLKKKVLVIEKFK